MESGVEPGGKPRLAEQVQSNVAGVTEASNPRRPVTPVEIEFDDEPLPAERVR